ncbi:ATP-binding cassette domain-containing protein [Candidatus Dojkabacteria bacterium]|nr:ATP-binding cassette domain-containing protein [Candidatus Dojkabacteria bacterium]
MAILEVKNLTKKFKDFTAVDNISFKLEEGEILGLLGPNGAGKTTTIQMLLAVLTPSSGEVTYFGKSIFEHRVEILERVNFSSTYINFPWEMTVRENLTYISYLYKIKNRKKRIKKIKNIFSLDKLMNKKIRELSDGQKTKINLAKSFINFPKVLLLDEPTASLDPDIANKIRKVLKNQRKEFNVSMIFTSHNMAEIEEVCDRVIFIDKGKIIAKDTPLNLAKSIKSAHVEFMGEEIDKIQQYCERNEINYEQEDNYIKVEVKEVMIPQLLKQLAVNNINYDEISIEKPSLEDYFLEVAKQDEENRT